MEGAQTVTSPDDAPDNAVHGRAAGEDPPVRLSPTRARTGAPGEAGSARDALPAVTGGIRSAVELARQRWGTPVGPVPLAEPDGQFEDDGPGQDRPRRSRAVLRCFRIWAEPGPAMAGVWADLVDGSRRVADLGWGWLVPYWLFGLPGFAVCCAARFVLDVAARPSRFAALLVAAGLFLAGLLVAGAI
jgi:hypothetical protein